MATGGAAKNFRVFTRPAREVIYLPLDLPEIPEWDGEPDELFAYPPSHEVCETRSARTAYELAHVLEEAAVFDPDFLDSLPL